jgi:hypothetical protein
VTKDELDALTRYLAERDPEPAKRWLRTGTRHPEEHWVIAAKLDGWAARVDADLRATLLAEIEGVAA